MNRPRLFTIILSVAAAASGQASPAAANLREADYLQSGGYRQAADSGREISTANSMLGESSPPGPYVTITGNGRPTDGDPDELEGALPNTISEPMSYVLTGAGLLGLGSFARRRRRTNE
jgi:LPXTG-motif cell wall-anchored protein